MLVSENNELLTNTDTTIEFTNTPFDVTGGMKRKLSESINIVKNGVPVYLINGFYPQRIMDVVEGGDFIGTSIKLQQGVKGDN